MLTSIQSEFRTHHRQDDEPPSQVSQRYPGRVPVITREQQHPLSGFGTTSSEAQVTIGRLTAGERLKRAAMGPVVGLGIAVIVLPIPIVHIIVPPLALIGGVVFGVMRGATHEIITAAHGPCPFCGTEQTFGLTGAAYKMPRNLNCRNCHKSFTIDAPA